MSRIVEIEILNFRGIRDLVLTLPPDQNLHCFMGRGDSGKSTVLEAISLVLSPKWSVKLTDTDFYNCNVNEPIQIEATLVDVPESLIVDSKFGTYIRGYDKETLQLFDNIDEEVGNEENLISALTVRLTVGKYLEPQWTIVNSRLDREIVISANDRSKLNCFLVADYLDNHFSWNKGNPLFTILKSLEIDPLPEETDFYTDSIRTIKEQIKGDMFGHLDNASLRVTEAAKLMGLDISEVKSSIDLREILQKESKVTLHDEKIPFRQRGKGTKRLASVAIQSVLVNSGGIMLIDEIEQGLEPDRVKTLARFLNEEVKGQVFITTHSRDVLSELGSQPIHHVVKDLDTNKIELTRLNKTNVELQKAIRACPEAFFADKVIVCEGATEVGLCRAIDKFMFATKGTRMSFHNTTYIDAGGSTLTTRTREISECMTTLLFCDSDVAKVNKEKDELKVKAKIVDCEDGFSLEQQIFKDAPWSVVTELLDYIYKSKTDSFSAKFKKQIKAEVDVTQWKYTAKLRAEIVEVFRPNEKGEVKSDWFKAIHHGEIIGDSLSKYFADLDPECRLHKNITDIIDWVVGD